MFFRTRAHNKAIVVRDVLLQEKALQQSFVALAAKDADKYYDEYASVVATIKEWRVKDPLAFQGVLDIQIVKSFELVGERREVLASIKSLMETLDKKDINDALTQAEAATTKITALRNKGAGDFCPKEEKGTIRCLTTLHE